MDPNNQIGNAQIENLAALLIKMTKNQMIITIEQFAKEYEDFVKSNHSKAYSISVEITFKHLVEFFPRIMELSSITQRESEKFIDALKNHAPKGYRVYYRNMKAAFNKAVDWGYLYENPFKKIKLPRKQQNQPEFITEEELVKILKQIETKAYKKGCFIEKTKSSLLFALSFLTFNNSIIFFSIGITLCFLPFVVNLLSPTRMYCSSSFTFSHLKLLISPKRIPV